MPFIVEAQPIDHGFVRGQPEDARLRVARLRQRRDGADLGEAKAELEQCIRHLGILVVAGCHADRVREIEPAKADLEPRVLRGR